MELRDVGMSGLKGWRAKVGDAVAQPVSQRSPLDADQVRAAVGAVFLLLSLVYVTGSIRRLLERTT